MTFRIRHHDNKNWVIEEFTAGGINPKTREAGADKWVIVGYYGQLKDLAQHLLDKSIVLADGASGQGIIQAIEKAEKSILENLSKK